jgi:hypothetical protein
VRYGPQTTIQATIDAAVASLDGYWLRLTFSDGAV